MLQYHFAWDSLSAIAGVTWWKFYLRLLRGSARAPQVELFLRHLLRHIPGCLLFIWDGLRQHRNRLVKQLVAQGGRRVAIEFLPPYAPRAESGGISVGIVEAA